MHVNLYVILALQTWYEVNLVAYNRDGDGEETVRSISTLPEGSSTIKDECKLFHYQS